MNDPAPDSSGRILRHGSPAGEVTAEAIEIHARELALIDGRESNQVTDQDRRQSRAELLGEQHPAASTEDEDAAAGASRDPAEPVSNTGTRAPQQSTPDEQNLGEQLALEGAEEARDDQMLAARREERRQP